MLIIKNDLINKWIHEFHINFDGISLFLEI